MARSRIYLARNAVIVDHYADHDFTAHARVAASFNPCYGTRARERGVSRAVEIQSGRELLSAAEFAKFIGVSREAVRGKHQRGEVLGLHGAKRGPRFPKWQVTPNGKLLPDLPQLFKLLGGDPWTVYRFLIQHHPELEEIPHHRHCCAVRSRKSWLPLKIPPRPYVVMDTRFKEGKFSDGRRSD
jgi:hypothetical protein